MKDHLVLTVLVLLVPSFALAHVSVQNSGAVQTIVSGQQAEIDQMRALVAEHTKSR